MNCLQNEECPVCFRTFSDAVIPKTTKCGHSFCQDCSGHFTRCPVCRVRLQNMFPLPTNYSLLSLATRVNSLGRKEMKDAEIQTEKPQVLRRAIVPRGVETVTPGVALSVIVRLTKIQQQLIKAFPIGSNGTRN